MGEKQEKVWVVMKTKGSNVPNFPRNTLPTKVFDDRSDARAYAFDRNERAVDFRYYVVGVKKG